MKVALIVMPFYSVYRPNLAVGILEASLKKVGIDCESKYFNVTFERMLGEEAYEQLASSEYALSDLTGEWVFSQLLFGQQLSTWERFDQEILEDHIWKRSEAFKMAILRALDLAPQFSTLVAESCDWRQYDLVGFTSTFEQTTASLHLARAIRERHPDVWIALGGANFEAEMARPYLKHFNFIDFISTGEAECSFPDLCLGLEALAAGESSELSIPPGFYYRDGAKIAFSGRPKKISHLDDLPVPEYSAYFHIAKTSTGSGETRPYAWLPIETSRGCWWGEKAHCTFCGLNGSGMAFRRKSWQRVVEEVDELARRHGRTPIQFTDNILSMEFFRDLIPYWSQSEDPTQKFFEVKSNLRRHHLKALHAAGIRNVQPGIESLLDHTLRIMRKGVTGSQNVAFLRWCCEIGIEASWNILYGFPGEKLDEFPLQLDLLRRMIHFPPAVSSGLIRVDRFSPNFSDWQEHGFSWIRPIPAYQHIFPFSSEELEEAAYFFAFDHPDLSEALVSGEAIKDFVQAWWRSAQDGQNGSLEVRAQAEDGLELIDTRAGRLGSQTCLNEIQMACLIACDAPRNRSKVIAQVAEAASEGCTSNTARELEQLIHRDVIVEIGSSLVTLALLPSEEQLKANGWWNRQSAKTLTRAT